MGVFWCPLLAKLLVMISIPCSCTGLMLDLCPICDALRRKWRNAVEKRKALERSIAEVQIKRTAIHEEHCRFAEYVEGVNSCSKCRNTRPEPVLLKRQQ
jgi:hypothetical protein